MVSPLLLSLMQAWSLGHLTWMVTAATHGLGGTVAVPLLLLQIYKILYFSHLPLQAFAQIAINLMHKFPSTKVSLIPS